MLAEWFETHHVSILQIGAVYRRCIWLRQPNQKQVQASTGHVGSETRAGSESLARKQAAPTRDPTVMFWACTVIGTTTNINKTIAPRKANTIPAAIARTSIATAPV